MRPFELEEEEDQEDPFSFPPAGEGASEDSDDSDESPCSLPPGAVWGGEYTADTCKYFPCKSKTYPFFRDEVFDLLVGEKKGEAVYPYRLKRDRVKWRVLHDFGKNLRRSWRVERDDDEGEFILLHEVKPGKRRGIVGDRKSRLGWKIVPTKEDAVNIIVQVRVNLTFEGRGCTQSSFRRSLRSSQNSDGEPLGICLQPRNVWHRKHGSLWWRCCGLVLDGRPYLGATCGLVDTEGSITLSIEYCWKPHLRVNVAVILSLSMRTLPTAQTHRNFHYGRDRALNEMNERYGIPNYIAKDLLARVKEQCHSCLSKAAFPRNPPTTPITSTDFGERILVDLKKLQQGYMIVSICHWSNYCWLGYLKEKSAVGVRDFLDKRVFEEIDKIRASWAEAHEEWKKSTKGRVSFPVNPGEVKTNVSDPIVKISVFHNIDDTLQQVRGSQLPGLKQYQSD